MNFRIKFDASIKDVTIKLRRFAVNCLKAVFLVPSVLVKKNAFRRFEDFKASISE